MIVVHLRLIGEAMVNQVELTERETSELVASSPDLEHLINWLDRLGQRATLKIIEEKLLNLNINTDEISTFLGYTDDGYQRNIVKKTDHYELVLICWKPGQKTPIHDHKGSDCAFLILEGVSTESIFVTEGDGLELSRVRKYAPGEVCAAGEPDIHRISNEEGINLVNLHLYTPPLRNINIYED
tara:strand:- start:966 stop:1517 length:552 start_codon:yes stop_codon:yes gene_type:complete